MEGEKNEQGQGRLSLPRRPLRAEALVRDTEQGRRRTSFTGSAMALSATAPPGAASSSISRKPGSTRRATRCTAFATPLPRSCSMPGMRLEVLQQLLGHEDIEVTRRYARLTDKPGRKNTSGPWRSSRREGSMETIESRYRRSLKRKNFSSYTIKNYMNRIDHFTLWLRVPLHEVTRREIGAYVDHLLRKEAVAEDDHLPFADDPALLRLPHRRGGDDHGEPRPKDLHPSAEASAPAPQGQRGGEVPCRHHRPEGQGHVHAHAPMRPPGGRGCPSHRRCGRVPEKAGVRGQRKRRQGQGGLSERRCPRRSRGLSAETVIEGEEVVPRPEGAAEEESRSPSGASRRGSSTMRERADSTCPATGSVTPSPPSF